MTDNVIKFFGETCDEIDPDKILDGALQTKLSVAIVIGLTEDDQTYFASSTGDIGENLFLVELFKQSLMTYATDS
jgi:hypothetical protein